MIRVFNISVNFLFMIRLANVLFYGIYSRLTEEGFFFSFNFPIYLWKKILIFRVRIIMKILF